ncbi:MAG: alginate lyase family protein [Acidobacteriaceae bacterium]|nr:alginate lyase family protein [Acidobacteriaceae bacterium]
MKLLSATALLTLSLATPLFASAAPLRSPWDERTVKITTAPYTCPALAALPADIEAYSYYSDAKKSVADDTKKAAYDAAKEPFAELSTKAAAAADNFQRTGNKAAAECVAQLLTTQAKASAMTGKMSSNQAQYVQNWTLGALAVSWLKVRQAQPATSEQLAVIQPWLQKVGRQVEAYFQERREKKKTDGQNNHLYWAGFAAMSAGIAVDDHSLFDWGISTYKDGLDRVTDDGTLPLEMARGQRALHYHLFALAPLTLMAEFATVNGQDLYSYNHNKLHLLVMRSLAGEIDNSFFSQKTGIPQDTPDKDGIKSSDVEWARPFQRRFPDPKVAEVLHSAGIKPFGYIGGLPPE